MISFAESYIFTRKLQPQMNHKGQLKRREKGFDEFFQWKKFLSLGITGNLARNTGALAGSVSRKKFLCMKFIMGLILF